MHSTVRMDAHSALRSLTKRGPPSGHPASLKAFALLRSSSLLFSSFASPCSLSALSSFPYTPALSCTWYFIAPTMRVRPQKSGKSKSCMSGCSFAVWADQRQKWQCESITEGSISKFRLLNLRHNCSFCHQVSCWTVSACRAWCVAGLRPIDQDSLPQLWIRIHVELFHHWPPDATFLYSVNSSHVTSQGNLRRTWQGLAESCGYRRAQEWTSSFLSDFLGGGLCIFLGSGLMLRSISSMALLQATAPLGNENSTNP